jgi:Rieske Fe-S protein
MPSRLEEDPIPRRDFLGLAGLWATAVAMLISLVGMVRLPKPAVLPEAARRFRIGKADEYPAGTSKVVPEQNLMVLSTDEGVAAISLVCTHLGCIVAKSDSGFSCPCHGTVFGADGKLLGGPAPRGLRWLEVGQSVDGRLVVNAGSEVESGTFFKV